MPPRAWQGAAWTLALGLVSSCGGGDAAPASPSRTNGSTELTPVVEGGDWPVAGLADEGLDAERLGALLGRIRGSQYGYIDSLLIARDGRLVLEEYFRGWSASTPHTLQSVTKSVTSLLTGIAIDRGRLATADRVVDFFPDYQPIANLDANKRALAVRDLLMMRSGFDWDETVYAGSPLERMNECRCDWIRWVLDWPLRTAPGTEWNYVSGGVVLLGAVVGVATGQRIDEFAEDTLFGPLGVEGALWVRGRPNGLPHTGGGLSLRSRDMAKLGEVVVEGGRWQGRPIVSAAWIAESTARRGSDSWAQGGRPTDYGYLWWILDGPGDVVAGLGALGQFIFVVPSLQLVVTVTSTNDNQYVTSPIQFFYDDILPAVR